MQAGLETRRLNECVVVALVGEHDLSTTSDVRSEVRSALDASRRLVVDLSAASFIDSSIAAELVTIANLASDDGGRLVIVAVPGSEPHRLLRLLQMTSVADVCRTVDEALARVGGRAPARHAQIPDELRERIIALHRRGMTRNGIAALLNRQHIPTARGGKRWYASTIAAVVERRRADTTFGDEPDAAH